MGPEAPHLDIARKCSSDRRAILVIHVELANELSLQRRSSKKKFRMA